MKTLATLLTLIIAITFSSTEAMAKKNDSVTSEKNQDINWSFERSEINEMAPIKVTTEKRLEMEQELGDVYFGLILHDTGDQMIYVWMGENWQSMSLAEFQE